MELVPDIAFGNLAEASFAEVLAAAFRASANGTVCAEQGRRSESRVYLDYGVPCGTVLSAGNPTFPDFLVEQGVIDIAAADRYAVWANQVQMDFSDVLIGEGVASAARMAELLFAFHQRALTSVCMLREGKYELRGWEPPPAWTRNVRLDAVTAAAQALATADLAERREFLLAAIGGTGVRLADDFDDAAARVFLSEDEQRVLKQLQWPLFPADCMAGLARADAEATFVSYALFGLIDHSETQPAERPAFLQSPTSIPPAAQRHDPEEFSAPSFPSLSIPSPTEDFSAPAFPSLSGARSTEELSAPAFPSLSGSRLTEAMLFDATNVAPPAPEPEPVTVAEDPVAEEFVIPPPSLPGSRLTEDMLFDAQPPALEPPPAPEAPPAPAIFGAREVELTLSEGADSAPLELDLSKSPAHQQREWDAQALRDPKGPSTVPPMRTPPMARPRTAIKPSPRGPKSRPSNPPRGTAEHGAKSIVGKRAGANGANGPASVRGPTSKPKNIVRAGEGRAKLRKTDVEYNPFMVHLRGITSSVDPLAPMVAAASSPAPLPPAAVAAPAIPPPPPRTPPRPQRDVFKSTLVGMPALTEIPPEFGKPANPPTLLGPSSKSKSNPPLGAFKAKPPAFTSLPSKRFRTRGEAPTDELDQRFDNAFRSLTEEPKPEPPAPTGLLEQIDAVVADGPASTTPLDLPEEEMTAGKGDALALEVAHEAAQEGIADTALFAALDESSPEPASEESSIEPEGLPSSTASFEAAPDYSGPHYIPPETTGGTPLPDANPFSSGMIDLPDPLQVATPSPAQPPPSPRPTDPNVKRESAAEVRRRLLQRAMKNMGGHAAPPVQEKRTWGVEVVDSIPAHGEAPVQRVMPEPAAVRPAPTPQEDVEADLKKRVAESATADHFTVLGVSREATTDEVKQAYLNLVKKYHPDRLTSQGYTHLLDQARQVFDRIAKANEALSTAEGRANYVAQISSTSDRKGGGGGSEDPKTLYKRAVGSAQRKDFAGAEADLRRAVAADAQPAYQAELAYVLMINASRREQSRDEIRDLVESALRGKSPNDRVYIVAAHASRLFGSGDKAEKMFRRAIEMNPKNVEAARELRLIEMRRGAEKTPGFFDRLRKK